MEDRTKVDELLKSQADAVAGAMGAVTATVEAMRALLLREIKLEGRSLEKTALVFIELPEEYDADAMVETVKSIAQLIKIPVVAAPAGSYILEIAAQELIAKGWTPPRAGASARPYPSEPEGQGDDEDDSDCVSPISPGSVSRIVRN